ncbi:4-(cytidine 5'-diphospho)-2-C-methyl-D-erythritol kinase [Nibricoccus sp. IMCC34717]|uniref:4-(cytidine 5'-diphospho)-2-C-methyl-D-erythritol kinase n=1 Tax=Nibricoccus sp. IMCC34717 TaxID=3034021 RepID=UPI00384C403A
MFSPAKLNLFLAITGRRADGFHELVSVVALLDWGDELTLLSGGNETFSLQCDHPEVPLDDTNLILRAAHAFRAATGITAGGAFTLRKRIPLGAGLGGGSGNAVTALRLLNDAHGQPLDSRALESIAASLGSDCVVFLRGEPQVMRGRGERVSPLPDAAASRLRGQRVLVFKPAFGIATAWAYQQMAARAPALYLPPAEAEARLASWTASAAPLPALLFNNMETAAFEKHVALPVLLGQLRDRFNVACGMSGSGSACFALLDEQTDTAALCDAIRDAWGAGALAIEAKIS